MTSKSPEFRRNLAYILQLPGYMGLLTSVAAVVFGEYLALIPFLGIAILTIIPGWLVLLKTHDPGEEGEIPNPVAFAALSYGLVSLIGAFPIYLTALILDMNSLATAELMNLYSPLNALFESFAGFTSSGLTMLENPEEIPHVIQLWRSLSQWFGGLGVIILAIFIFSPGVKGIKRLIHTEVGNVSVADDVHVTAQNIGLIYILFTITAFLLYLLVNQPVWVSLNQALTSVSTGGFNVTNESFQFQPAGSKIISLVLITVGALKYTFHREFFILRNPKSLLNQRENLWFLIILIVGIFLMAAESRWLTGAPSLMDNIYQWVSALTTSGFQTADLEQWETGKLFLLSLAMLIGGVGGSTAGGLKIRRILLLINIIFYSLIKKKNKQYSEGVKAFGEGENIEEILFNFISLIGLWLFLLSISVLIISFLVSDQYGLAEILFEVTSAQSNVGLSTGLTGADMHWFIKLDFMLLMWMGRLELIAVLFFFTNWFRGGKE